MDNADFQQSIRVVLDANVFLQALLSASGPAAMCLSLVKPPNVELCVSEDILKELADVLGRPNLRSKFPAALTSLRIRALMTLLREGTAFVDSVPRRFAYRRDPRDEPYINLAIETKADYLASRDDDLLSLMDRGNPDGAILRTLAPHLEILDPVKLLERLRKA